jgi:hypothetical protein
VGAVRSDDGETSYLLIINLTGTHAGSLSEESFAVLPAGERWEVVLASNEARFGGTSPRAFDSEAQSCSFIAPEVVLLRNRAADFRETAANNFFPGEAPTSSGTNRLVL